jgi:hypothetical protein
MKNLKLTFAAIALTLTFFSSCKNNYESNQKTMESLVKKKWDNIAFKENSEIKYLDYRILKYDTVTENRVDTSKQYLLLSKISSFNNQLERLMKLRESEGRLMKLYNELGDHGATYQNTREDFINHGKEFQLVLDSVYLCQKQDSIIQLRINKNKNPKPVYRAQVFMKAVLSKEGKSENYMDTLYYFFKPDLTMIDVN